MTKNNLKVVKTDTKKDQELKEKNKALNAAISQIDDNFGKGSVMRLGQQKAMDVESISTGSLSLDLALGIGGLPKGRVIEIYGPESSGKTTLALQVVAEAQKTGGICGFVDAEHALDPVYAKKLGVKTDELLISQPDTGEQALEIADTLIKSGSLSVLVVDSVAALTPKAELEGEMGDHHVGLQSRLMSQALRKLTGSISKSNTMVIFINQIRMKIGVMFGNPETTSGGNALKFYSYTNSWSHVMTLEKDGNVGINKAGTEYQIYPQSGLLQTGLVLIDGFNTLTAEDFGTTDAYATFGDGIMNGGKADNEMIGDVENMCINGESNICSAFCFSCSLLNRSSTFSPPIGPQCEHGTHWGSCGCSNCF